MDTRFSELYDRLSASAPEGVHRLLGRAVEASSNGVIISDARLPDNPVVYVNPAFERITGYSREESLGRNCRFLQGEEHDQPGLRELRAALREGRDCRVVLRNYRSDGAPFWNELYVSPVYDAAGTLTHFVGVQNDVTERRAVEEALREGEERFRTTFEGAAIGIAHVAPDGSWLRVNRKLSEIVGYGREELLGKTFQDITHPDDLKDDLAAVRRLLAGLADTYSTEKRYIRKDGSVVWIHLTVSLVREPSGKPRYFIAAVEDIGRRRAAEEELRRQARLLDLTQDSVIVRDVEDRVFFWNRGAQEDYGWSFPEVRGRRSHELLKTVFPEPLDEIKARLHRDGYWEGELTHHRRDGTRVVVASRWALQRDEAGEPAAVLEINNDVTERKRAEEERERLLAQERVARSEAEAARRRMALLAAAGPVLSVSLDHAATLDRVTRLFVPELADWCLLDLVGEDGTARQAAGAHADPEKEALLEELGRCRCAGGTPPEVEPVLKTGRGVLLSDISTEAPAERTTDARYLELLGRLDPRSYVCVPLVARDRTLGAITLVSGPGRRYDEEDFALAESLAYRCALAVDNARLYRERGEISRALQGGLLPRELPEIPGVEVGLRYLSAGEGEVGGDFYDLFETGGDGDGAGSGAWGVLIGDVSGKGPKAAAVTAQARYTVRAVALQNDSPAGVLRDLNRAMIGGLAEHRFCTAAYARLKPEPGGATLTFARAGHPAPLLLRKDGAVEPLGRAGRAIGVFEDPELAEQKVRLEPGDAVVLYTDGVIEARDPDGSLFGERRLADLLGSLAGRDAENLARSLKGAVLDFGAGEVQDDVAILVLRVRPVG